MNFTARQLEILNTSLDIISKDGVQNFTMRLIASEIGISEPAIYRHFPNKVAILEALLDQFQQRQNKLAKQYLDGSELSGVVHFLLEVLKNLSEKPALSAIIFSEEIFQNEPILRKKVVEIMESTENSIVSHLNNFPITRFIPTKHLAWILLGSVRFLVTRWRLSGFDFDLKTEGEAVINNIMNFHPTIGNKKE